MLTTVVVVNGSNLVLECTLASRVESVHRSGWLALSGNPHHYRAAEMDGPRCCGRRGGAAGLTPPGNTCVTTGPMCDVAQSANGTPSTATVAVTKPRVLARIDSTYIWPKESEIIP